MVFQQKGFTVIELMVTVTVLAIAAAIAIPSFTEQIRNNRSITVANEFVDAISFARAQAASRPARVSICASNDGETCGGDWSDGYIIFVDDVANDTAVPPQVGTVLKVVDPNKNDIEMAAAFDGNATNFIRFTSLGTLARISVNPLTVQTKVKNCKGNYARAISITPSGQTAMSPQDCNVTF